MRLTESRWLTTAAGLPVAAVKGLPTAVGLPVAAVKGLPTTVGLPATTANGRTVQMRLSTTMYIAATPTFLPRLLCRLLLWIFLSKLSCGGLGRVAFVSTVACYRSPFDPLLREVVCRLGAVHWSSSCSWAFTWTGCLSRVRLCVCRLSGDGCAQGRLWPGMRSSPRRMRRTPCGGPLRTGARLAATGRDTCLPLYTLPRFFPVVRARPVAYCGAPTVSVCGSGDSCSALRWSRASAPLYIPLMLSIIMTHQKKTMAHAAQCASDRMLLAALTSLVSIACAERVILDPLRSYARRGLLFIRGLTVSKATGLYLGSLSRHAWAVSYRQWPTRP